MPLVFVHGVDNRKNEDYLIGQKKRDAFFRRYAFPEIMSDPGTSKIFNPYWGDLAAKLAWNGASLPGKEFEAFGSDDTLAAQIILDITPGTEKSPHEPLLVAIASQGEAGLVKAIDTIWAAAAVFEDKTISEETDQSLADLSDTALAYAAANPSPEWIQDKRIRTDAAFIERLLDEIKAGLKDTQGQVETFGLGDFRDVLKESFDRLAGLIPRAGSNLLIEKLRPLLNDKLSRFLGDVFVYLRERKVEGQPGPIAKTIIEALDEASQTRSNKDPLIIVAHSMGGNIVYDILSSYRTDLQCDVLITVGSQVGLFEELKLFNSSNKEIPTEQNPLVAKPKNIERWINVFDQTDILSYSGAEIFEEIKDYEYNTGSGLFGAHSMYFYMPSFHKRLRERLLEKIV